MRIFFCCPTWIRTKTNRTKICRTTIILSGILMERKNKDFIVDPKFSTKVISSTLFSYA